MANTNFETQKAAFMSSERYEELVTLCLINGANGSSSADVEIGKSYLLYKPSSSEAVKYFRRAADAGDTTAMYLLGICYKYGLGTEPDQEKAFMYFKHASDLDYTPAAIHAALQCECTPSDTGADFTTAFDIYQNAASAGDPMALFKVAQYFEHGNGVDQDFEEAFKMCRIAANAGNVRAMTSLGRYYEYGIGTDISIPDAIHYYEMAAAEKNIPAQYALRRLVPDHPMQKTLQLYSEVFDKVVDALSERYPREKILYANHPANAKDPESLLICGILSNAVKRFCAYAYDFAFESFYKAACAGIPEALWYTADYFMAGKYALRNQKFAFELFRRAADQDYTPALWALGFFYELGLFVDADIKKAVEYYQTAADRGYNPAKVTLAIMYETGIYFDADFEKANEYYAAVDEDRSLLEPWAEIDKSFVAINISDDVLQYRIYRYEEIRSMDSSKFFGSYSRLSDLGNVYAMYRLAHMYEEGTSKSTKRPDRAFYYYKKAAELGYAPAKADFDRFCSENPTVVARYYASADSTESNTEKAFELYRTAAESGNASAMLHTAKCYYEGIGTEKDEALAYHWACRAKHAGQHVSLEFGRHIITYPDEIQESELISYLGKNRSHPWALYALGCCVETGFCIDKDEALAGTLYYNAAEGDYRWAHFAVARYYEQTSSLAKDISYAYDQYLTALLEEDQLAVQYFSSHMGEYMQKAAASPRSNALDCLIAYCTEKGYGTETNHQAAFEAYKALADNGYVPAIRLYGRCMEQGIGTRPDTEAALNLYLTAAKANYGPAMCDAGRCMEMYHSNILQAKLWYSSAAGKKNSEGIFYLGKLTCKSDLNSGLAHILTAAEAENPKAQFFLGNYYENSGDLDTALVWYRRAADGDYTDAEVSIGKYYLRSSEPAQKRIAFEYFSHASRKGNSDAMLHAAECIARGLGVQKNPSGAVKYYTKAAHAGNMYAQYSLGSCYERGFGVDVDLAKAVEYYTMAANQGHDDAQYALGSCYAKAKGIEQNMQMAIYWYEQAVRKNNDKAGTALGICYENGQGGLAVNPEMAVRLYSMSAEKGNYIAQYRLGLCYEKGKFVPADPQMAFMWFLRSAEAGNTIAQYKVGECYFTGFGTNEDISLAVEWYKKAANAKSADAARKLAWCYENGYGVERNKDLAAEWYDKAVSYSAKSKKGFRKNN